MRDNVYTSAVMYCITSRALCYCDAMTVELALLIRANAPLGKASNRRASVQESSAGTLLRQRRLAKMQQSRAPHRGPPENYVKHIPP